MVITLRILLIITAGSKSDRVNSLINIKFIFFFSVKAGGDGMYHLKVLVPGVAAGAIIGKGGETIAQLQKDTDARVKMSKARDFYPGKN